MLEDKFLTKIEEQKKNIKEYSNIYSILGTLRLISMIGLIYFIYKALNSSVYSKYLGLSILMACMFIALIIKHSNIKNKLKFSKEMININKKYVDRINGQWAEFQDRGEEFISEDHPYSGDLDIVGKESLFQLINTTNTKDGRDNLAKLLLEPNKDKDEIILKQRAVKELGEKLEFCQNLEYTTGKYKEKLKSTEKLMKYITENSVLIKSKVIKNILYIMPLITVPLSLSIIILKLKNLYTLVGILGIVQCLIWMLKALKINAILQSIDKLKYNFQTYSKVLKLIEKEEVKCEKLKSIKEVLFNEEESSIKAIKELNIISEKVNLRYNGILYIVLNIFFLWDYQCVFSLEAWKLKYGDKIEKWLNGIGEIESLASLAVLTHINDKISFPNIYDSDEKTSSNKNIQSNSLNGENFKSEKDSYPNLKLEHGNNLKIECKNIGHPLINIKDRVCNDLTMKNNILLITGSNMSGKTTFLRTLGINLVLAYSGAPVCAEEMSSSLMDIYTSMRITDDLKGGISTFYRELIKIKNIINHSKNKIPMIFLIDEIFRGTNSKDRYIGAKNVLFNLNKPWIIGGLTTHDLELCVLDKDEAIKNYHFSEYYKNNKIYFDYKIKKGQSTTTNAKYLMNMVGIEILEE
ncbi:MULTISPECIES: MutS-related protein [Clostridium]|uniref:MutS-related protein n=1 Tax=Clostridium TaxID=1485 RepID=UPI00223771B0|nr:DNA mismatch repair protein MutS [Clostridium sporogenes]MCW6074906.1 DNA mismatch repair protein MutS [Clostridium sporogenes]MCW6109680.1 DNA mismatch repair protein MutS [Clostridium sporogenes]